MVLHIIVRVGKTVSKVRLARRKPKLERKFEAVPTLFLIGLIGDVLASPDPVPVFLHTHLHPIVVQAVRLYEPVQYKCRAAYTPAGKVEPLRLTPTITVVAYAQPIGAVICQLG